MIEAHSALFFVNRLVQFTVHERQLIAKREAIAGDLSDAALRGKAGHRNCHRTVRIGGSHS